jgi:DNA-binding MarR family transcriptional regulator
VGERDELSEVLLREMPWYVSAAVRHQIAVANQLRLPVTDVHAIGTLLEFGPIGVRRLAELMGMTTGATTRLVDRLERGGFVTRERDTRDRRQVVLHVVADRVAEIGRYYAPVGERWRAQLADCTDEQLRFLVDFLRRGREYAQAETEALRASGRAHGSRPRREGPGSP